MGGAGPAYLRELSLLQRNTAAGDVGPVTSVFVRHLPGMSEEGTAGVSRSASGGSSASAAQHDGNAAGAATVAGSAGAGRHA
jgi:hypothetical protein